MTKKRIRASNFSESEENVLVQCILRHVTIIENKKTDASTLKEKQRAWEEIGNEFNSICPNIARKSKALKDKYTNIKTMLRKQFAVVNGSHKATSGGIEIPKWRPRNQAMAELAKLISISMNGTSPVFDGESLDIESSIIESVDGEKPVECSTADFEKHGDTFNQETVDLQPASTLSKPWLKYTPSKLRKPKSSQLKRSIAAVSSLHSDKEDSLKSLKRKLIERELEMREIEHRTRLNQQLTEHKARMALLEAQKTDFESKVKLRKLKIAKFTNDQSSETETDSE